MQVYLTQNQLLLKKLKKKPKKEPRCRCLPRNSQNIAEKLSFKPLLVNSVSEENDISKIKD